MIVALKIESLRLPQKLLYSLETYRSHGPAIPLILQSSARLMKSQLLSNDPLAFGTTVPSGAMGSPLLSGKANGRNSSVSLSTPSHTDQERASVWASTLTKEIQQPRESYYTEHQLYEMVIGPFPLIHPSPTQGGPEGK